jgi:hypothetical protein
MRFDRTLSISPPRVKMLNIFLEKPITEDEGFSMWVPAVYPYVS